MNLFKNRLGRLTKKKNNLTNNPANQKCDPVKRPEIVTIRSNSAFQHVEPWDHEPIPSKGIPKEHMRSCSKCWFVFLIGPWGVYIYIYPKYIGLSYGYPIGFIMFHLLHLVTYQHDMIWATDNIWCVGLAHLNLVSVLSFPKAWYHRPRYRFLVSVIVFRGKCSNYKTNVEP